jgi:hypothetical protein
LRQPIHKFDPVVNRPSSPFRLSMSFSRQSMREVDVLLAGLSCTADLA